MTKGRLEAFSDGVIAIIITIMVLELKPPAGHDWASMLPLLHTLLAYVLSFIYVGIYWNNHHHMLHATQKVDGRILWANLHLLFWLSLIPFITEWIGEANFTSLPVSLYGVVLLMSGVAYKLLSLSLIARHGKDSTLARAIGKDIKGNASVIIYAIAIGVSFYHVWIAIALYIVVAIVWFIPDKRIENVLAE